MSKSDQMTSQKIDAMPATKILPISNARPATRQKPDQRRKLIVMPRMDYPPLYPPTSGRYGRPPPPLPPPTPPTEIFKSLDMSQRKDKKKKKSDLLELGSSYTPSIEAVFFNIKGRKPMKEKYETGLTLRPMVR